MSSDREPGATIRREVAERGPIGFDRYMELALYGPDGFFQRPVVGTDADFVTSPHVHPFVFSRALRAAILETWAALGEPSVLRVVELGAGDGTLAAALLEAFAELPAPAIDHTAVEIGTSARASLADRGLVAVDALDQLEPFEGVIVANELLDNLPFRLARREGDDVVEVRITVEDERVSTVEMPWSDRADRPDPHDLHEGLATVVPVGVAALLSSIAARLRRGVVIAIDYGDHGPVTDIRGYARHREIDDVLRVAPGASDITAGIDLGLVVRLAEASGLRAFEPVRQRAALEALGVRRWDETMRARHVTLEREGRHAEALRVFESRSRASILLDPARLGSFWWLVLSTLDVPEPGWLAAARRSAG